MGKKRKAEEKEQEERQLQPEPASAPSESREEEEVSSSGSSEIASDSDSDVEDSPLSSPSPDDVVNVYVEFFDPKPDDFHGAKALLRTYLDDVRWDINGFVELFLAQTTVGSVVKIEGSPVGIISALNLARYQDCACMKQVRQYLQGRSGGQPEANQLERFLTEKAEDVGLLVSERLINIPMDPVPDLYEALFKEISSATEQEPTEELQNSFKFKHYVILTKVFEERPLAKKPKSSENGQVENGKADPENLIFIKPEDEELLKLSSWSFTFDVKAEASAAHEFISSYLKHSPKVLRIRKFTLRTSLSKSEKYRMNLEGKTKSVGLLFQTKNMRQLRLVMGVEAKQIPVFLTDLKVAYPVSVNSYL